MSQPISRSQAKRMAIQRGEPYPTFDATVDKLVDDMQAAINAYKREGRSWFDLVMHHANQMLAYTPPEEESVRQQIMQIQNTLAKMKSRARRPVHIKVKPR